MAILDYSEATERKIILYEGQPYEVLSSHVFRKQMRKPVNATKLKNLITGKITEVSFHQSEKIAEADVEYKDAKFLYKNKNELWFCDPKNPSDRFNISEGLIGNPAKFMKANSIVETLVFNEKVIGVRLPIKVDLKVTEAPYAVKGDTSSGGTKQITLETGAIINAPLFITEGETISVNTETGDYVSRVGNK
ncbi:MAG: elongation factor P [Candidatus Pacebacteria bacterium]|nr:elongation factor P [Candidatus Paceibacterota bacterium]